MSFERLWLFEIGDISAVHFSCGKCGSEIVRKTGKLHAGSWVAAVTSSCPDCHTPSGIQPGSAEGDAFLTFVDSVGKMAQAINGRNLRIRLEVKCPEGSKG